MSGALSGQVAIVTGGGRGIGRAIAIALAEAGAAVAIVARSADQITDAAAAISRTEGRALSFPADVTDEAQVRKAVDAVAQKLGPVTLLVNNAGTPGPVGAAWEVDAGDWWRCIEVSVRGAFLCSQVVLPAMLERGRGRIINIVSTTGIRPVPGLTATSIAKTALIRFTEGLAEETKGKGIGIFALHPGLVQTEMIKSYLQSPGLDSWMPGLRQVPDDRWTPPEAAGRLCVRIASGDCDKLSGRFIAATDDIEHLISQADAIREGQLCVLRMNTLQA